VLQYTYYTSRTPAALQRHTANTSLRAAAALALQQQQAPSSTQLETAQQKHTSTPAPYQAIIIISSTAYYRA
jgi:hypothetical protein